MNGVWRRPIIRLLAVPVIAFLAIAGFAIARFHAPGPTEQDTTVVLLPGTGLSEISKSFAAADIILDETVFRLGVRITGNSRSLRAGEYLIPAGVTMCEVMEILVSGETVLRRLTVAEGLTVAEVLGLVDEVEALDGVRPEAPGEGSLLPETYYFSYGDGRSEVVARMAAAMAEALDELWPLRAPGLPLESPEDALILASIVEKETAVPDERPRVAAVFINRLRRGMRLQSDPTVVYGLTGGRGPLDRALTRADLQRPSPYNTYVIGGLPPGPIANPGRAAIEAVLHPLDTDEFYFVADGNGGHAFARTLREHQENVARWRAIQREGNNE